MKHALGIALATGLTSLLTLAQAQPEKLATPTKADQNRIARRTNDGPVYKPTFVPGTKAPELTIKKWYQGEALKAVPPGKVTLVEFVRVLPDDGASRASLDALAKVKVQHPEVEIVSIAFVVPKDQMGGSDPYAAWVESAKDKLTWRFGVDDLGRSQIAWVSAAGTPSPEPMVFIVDKDGIMQWAGSPLRTFPIAFERVISGTWDAAKYRRSREMLADLARLRADGENDRAAELAQQIFDLDPELNREVALTKLEILCQTKQNPQLKPYVSSLIESAFHNDADGLRAVGQFLSRQPTINGNRHLDLAIMAAERASQLLEEKDYGTFELLASLHRLNLDNEAALKAIVRAIEVAPEGQRPRLQRIQDTYEKNPPKAPDPRREMRALRQAPPPTPAPVDDRPVEQKPADPSKDSPGTAPDASNPADRSKER